MYELSENNITLETNFITFAAENTIMNAALKKINNVQIIEEAFFNVILCFYLYWDYEANYKYTSEKVLDITPLEKFHLKCDCVVRSEINGVTEPTIFVVALVKSIVFKRFCETETMHY